MSDPTNPPSSAPQKKGKKKYLLLLLLLLLLLGGGTVTYYNVTKDKIPKLVLTPQGETEIHAGQIVMKVWDDEAEDGDVIQVYFNGKMIADSLAILNTPVEYKLGKLSSGTYTIGVKALDEGSSSPASVRISLTDGKVEKEFSMNATLLEGASWKVIVK